MSNEQNIERIYDLLEQFDFDALTENDKALVLEQMSREEYQAMRATITDTHHFFTTYTFPSKESAIKPFHFANFLRFPLELYKVAAILIVMLSCGFTLGRISNKSGQQILAQTVVDTVFVEKTNTVFTVQYDTIQVVKTILSKSQQFIAQSVRYENEREQAAQAPSLDCNKVLCPNDIDVVNRIKNENSFSKDSILKEFIVSLY